MKKHILKRLIFSILVIAVVVTLLYFSAWFAMINKYSWIYKDLDMLPIIWRNYLEYIRKIVTEWDWGMTSSGKDIWDFVFSKAHYTIKITLASTVFFVVFGIALGIVAAIHKHTWIDRLISNLTTAFSSVPSFVMLWFLMLTFGWGLKWFPAIYPIGTEDPIKAVLGLVIPVLALSLWPLSKFIQLVRGELIEHMDAEYMLLARTKGLTKTQGILRHLTRNTIIVVLPELTNSFMFVLGSSFLIEIVYNVPGMARIFYHSVVAPFGEGSYVNIDVQTMIFIATFYIVFAIVMTLIFDVLYSIVDPRIRMGSKKYH